MTSIPFPRATRNGAGTKVRRVHDVVMHSPFALDLLRFNTVGHAHVCSGILCHV